MISGRRRHGKASLPPAAPYARIRKLPLCVKRRGTARFRRDHGDQLFEEGERLLRYPPASEEPPFPRQYGHRPLKLLLSKLSVAPEPEEPHYRRHSFLEHGERRSHYRIREGAHKPGLVP